MITFVLGIDPGCIYVSSSFGLNELSHMDRLETNVGIIESQLVLTHRIVISSIHEITFLSR